MTISSKMENNIKNYSKEIITLEDFVEAVRLNFGMWIGYGGNKGFINMIREIFQNSIDELMKDASPCTEIIVSYDERNHNVIIEDNGRGLPFDDMIRIYTSQHTSSNYNKKDGEFSSGKHGVGGKVTNALSDSFIVESYILGEARRLEFVDGKPSKKGMYPIPNNNNKQGSIIMFHPTYEIMGKITTTAQDVLDLINLILPLTKIGAIVYFNAIRLDGSEVHEKLVNEDGIILDLINKTINPLIKPIIAAKTTGKMKAEIAFTYDSNDLMTENISSYSNFCPMKGGTHVDGFTDALCRFFRDYMNKIYLVNSKNKKLTVVNNDIKTGLKAIVTVSHLYPIFTGQAKETLGNEDMFYFVRNLMTETLDQWSKENSAELQRLCKYLKEIAEIRLKSDEGKIRLKDQYQSSALTGLPKKYIKPNGREHLELIIVEGDSAAGSIEITRCSKRQGVFPIRGKIPNAFTTSKSKFLSNEEIAGIITIIGGGYGKSFDITRVKWEKIVFAADSDDDARHIRALLLRFFILYLPELITAGKVFSAVPPLYGLKIGKKQTYFIEKMDFVRYNQREFSKNNQISTLNNKSMTVNEIVGLLFSNIDYVYEVETIGNRYSINYNLLELILINRNKSMKELNKILKSKFRFIEDLTMEKNTVVIKGLIDSKSQIVFLNERLLTDSKNIIDHIDRNMYMFYKINGVIRSLYDLMRSFKLSTPPNITRFKGLGEMDPQQLADSTLHPDTDRTLIQYTIDDVKSEIETIQYLESNKGELIKDIKVSRSDIF